MKALRGVFRERKASITCDAGSVSVAIIAGTAFVMVIMLGLVDLSIFFVARARAQTAADASALAAAGELLPQTARGGRNESAAEEQAGRFASANQARLLFCDCRRGQSVTVVVAIPVRFVMISPVAPREVKARARAQIDLKNPDRGPEGR